MTLRLVCRTMSALEITQQQPMASDQAKRVFLACFQALSGQKGPDAVGKADAKMREMARQPGYSVVLASIFGDKRIESPYRSVATILCAECGCSQMSGILLINFIQERWENSSQKPGPAISEKEKIQLRNILPALLSDPNHLLRTAASMSIAAIGAVDYPEKWPQLLPSLVKCLNTRDNPNLVQGALRTVSALLEDLTSHQIAKFLPQLFPGLLAILKEPRYPLKVRANAIRVYGVCVLSLAELRGTSRKSPSSSSSSSPEKDLSRALLLPTLKPWLEALLTVLRGKLTLENTASPSGWVMMQLEAVRALRRFQKFFSDIFSSFRPAFTKTMMQGLAEVSAVYQKGSVESDVASSSPSDDAAFDEDGDRVGLPMYLSYVMEFVTESVRQDFKGKTGLAKCRPQETKSTLTALAKCAVAYLRVTVAEEKNWSENPEEFVLYDDNIEHIFTPRAAATSLIDVIALTGRCLGSEQRKFNLVETA
eukprot:jgi/Bigna1/142524/aug1.70_g17232